MKRLLFAVVVVAIALMPAMAMAQGPITVNTTGQVAASCALPGWVGGVAHPTPLSLEQSGVIYPVPGPATTPITVYAFFDVAVQPQISSAFAVVYESDGVTVKVPQLTLTELTCAEATTLLQSWEDAGLISDATRQTWLMAVCNEDWELWAGTFPYDIHQDPGAYPVQIYASGMCGGSAAFIGGFEFRIAPFVYLAVDFNAVNYQNITAGAESWVVGNRIWEPPASTAPTIWNQGNVNANVSIDSTALIPGAPWSGETDKHIVNFDARLGRLALRAGEDGFQPEDYDFVGVYSTLYYTAADAARLMDGVLYPCVPDKIDFSVDPPATQVLVPATYTGSMTLALAAAP